MVSVKCQVQNMLSNNSPRKEKLRRKILNLRTKLRYRVNKFNKITHNELMDLNETKFGKNIVNVWREQVKNKNKKTGRRYSTKYKKFALKIYYASPRAYIKL